MNKSQETITESSALTSVKGKIYALKESLTNEIDSDPEHVVIPLKYFEDYIEACDEIVKELEQITK